MPDFDFLLKQITDKEEKLNKKIDLIQQKVIPMKQEKDALNRARLSLESAYDKEILGEQDEV